MSDGCPRPSRAKSGLQTHPAGLSEQHVRSSTWQRCGCSVRHSGSAGRGGGGGRPQALAPHAWPAGRPRTLTEGPCETDIAHPCRRHPRAGEGQACPGPRGKKGRWASLFWKPRALGRKTSLCQPPLALPKPPPQPQRREGWSGSELRKRVLFLAGRSGMSQSCVVFSDLGSHPCGNAPSAASGGVRPAWELEPLAGERRRQVARPQCHPRPQGLRPRLRPEGPHRTELVAWGWAQAGGEAAWKGSDAPGRGVASGLETPASDPSCAPPAGDRGLPLTACRSVLAPKTRVGSTALLPAGSRA